MPDTTTPFGEATPSGRFVEVDVAGFRGTVHVREDGPPGGVPLLLVHGFSGSMYWYDLVVAQLRDRYRIIRLDLLGHGSTRGPAADAPLQARAVDDVLATLGLTGVTAVGHSFGADVAVELAVRSARVERLVIVCQAPDYSDAQLPFGRQLMTLPVLGAGIHRVAGGLALGLNAGLHVVRPHAAGRAVTDQAVRDFRALNPAMFAVVLVQRRDRLAAHPLDAQVREAGRPTLVILGGRDHFYGDRSAPRYRSAGAQVEILPESGHSPLMERPADTARLIAAFIDAG